MGLDQYAYAVMPHKDNTDLGHVWGDETDLEGARSILFHQWRKHANLQGYMEELYRSKGGDKEFNCQYVRLTFHDLLELKEAVVNSRLPQTTGFFFGQSDERHDEETLEFVEKAIKAITQDMEIYYGSWW
jgi:hypothetical protein